MKLLSFLTLSALLTISACSHGPKSCCAKKEAVACSKDMKCSDGSCTDDKSCVGDSCKKK